MTAVADSTADQSDADNRNISIRVFSPGNNGHVEQTNENTAGATEAMNGRALHVRQLIVPAQHHAIRELTSARASELGAERIDLAFRQHPLAR